MHKAEWVLRFANFLGLASIGLLLEHVELAGVFGLEVVAVVLLAER